MYLPKIPMENQGSFGIFASYAFEESRNQRF